MRRAVTLSIALAVAIALLWANTHFYGGTMELGDRSLFGGIGLEPGTVVLFTGSGFGFNSHPGNHFGRNPPRLITLQWTLTGIDPWGNYSPREISYHSWQHFYIRCPIPLIFVFPLAFIPILSRIFGSIFRKTSEDAPAS